jgi:aldose 1-epimerase
VITFDTLGASIASIVVPDARGNPSEVTVHADSYAGRTIGRFADRIAGASFELDGRRFDLRANEGRNLLHGGPQGWSTREWELAGPSALRLHSSDGDQGFPGAVDCTVTYTWKSDTLRIDYEATTDKPTVINLTNHVYFNLGGEIADHTLQIDGASYTPLDDELIATGEIADVAGTRFDFRSMRPIGAEPYDINLVIDGWDGSLRRVAQLHCPQRGRSIIVETMEPGLQIYTGARGAIALETQHFADSPHHPNFPSTVLRPGETFRSTTVYRFAAA